MDQFVRPNILMNGVCFCAEKGGTLHAAHLFAYTVSVGSSTQAGPTSER